MAVSESGMPVVKRPKHVNPDAAITLTAVYCPSIVAMMYSGLPTSESTAVDKLTIFNVRMVLDSAPSYSSFHLSSSTLGRGLAFCSSAVPSTCSLGASATLEVHRRVRLQVWSMRVAATFEKPNEPRGFEIAFETTSWLWFALTDAISGALPRTFVLSQRCQSADAEWAVRLAELWYPTLLCSGFHPWSRLVHLHCMQVSQEASCAGEKA
jgi:hypothetical protein